MQAGAAASDLGRQIGTKAATPEGVGRAVAPPIRRRSLGPEHPAAGAARPAIAPAEAGSGRDSRDPAARDEGFVPGEDDLYRAHDALMKGDLTFARNAVDQAARAQGPDSLGVAKALSLLSNIEFSMPRPADTEGSV